MTFPPPDLPLLSWSRQDRTLEELREDDPEAIREVWRAIVVCLVGYGATDQPPGRRRAYQDIVGPAESPGMRKDMLAMSGCGLVAGCGFRCAGVRDPSLDPPYRVGWAIDRLRLIALKCGACMTPRPGLEPGVGDVVYVGHPKPPKPKDPEQLELWQRAVLEWQRLYGGEAHVLVTVAYDGTKLVSVDGGQRDQHGAQCIRRCDRDVQWQGTKLWIGGRRCTWFVDCLRLRYAEPWVLPVPGPGIETYE